MFSMPHCTICGYHSTSSRPPMMPEAMGTVMSATAVAFSPKIEMPKGSATRNVRKIPVTPRTFSRTVPAVTSTVLPLKRAASYSL
jgi:hypothetical protein